MNPWRRVRFGLVAIAVVVAIGTSGYVMLGLEPLDALYQTVTTITTVGFREVGGEEFGPTEQLYTIVLILFGTGVALYTFSTLLEALVEGQIRDLFGRRRMDRKIADLKDHVIICGWGRAGQALAEYLAGNSQNLVVIERDPERSSTIPHLYITADATLDETLRQAGIDRARALVASVDTDAENLFVTVTARALRPNLFIVARVRTASAEEKFRRAGADRVVNPQQIGGQRMGAFVLQPHVSEFLDVVMHDDTVEFLLRELQVPPDSPLTGQSLHNSQIRDRTGALVLAMRSGDQPFRTNPDPGMTVEPGDVLIAIGTAEELDRLRQLLATG